VEAPLQPVATATKGGGMISLAIIDPNTKKTHVGCFNARQMLYLDLFFSNKPFFITHVTVMMPRNVTI
jgi:hypothetical protein